MNYSLEVYIWTFNEIRSNILHVILTEVSTTYRVKVKLSLILEYC